MSKSLYTTIIEETAPTTTTVGVVGQLYLDSTTKILYQCVAINIEDLTYEWKQIGGGASQEDFDKLVNNTIQIKNSEKPDLLLLGGGKRNLGSTKAGIAIGNGATVHTTGNIAIGKDAYATNSGSIAIGDKANGYSAGISIGQNSSATTSSIAIGSYAVAKYDEAAGSGPRIQIGQGTNSIPNTLQIENDNIYNFGTHTLTVQNIELNGTDLNTTINEVTSKAMRALVTPVSAPSKIELVAVDSTNAQTMIEIGDGIVLESGVLKSKYWEEVIYSGDELFKTNTTYNFTKAVGSYETIELELRSGGHNSSYFVKMKTIPSGGNTYIYFPEHNDSVLNQIVISFTDTSMTVENSLIELSDYDNWVLQKIRWIHR